MSGAICGNLGSHESDSRMQSESRFGSLGDRLQTVWTVCGQSVGHVQVTHIDLQVTNITLQEAHRQLILPTGGSQVAHRLIHWLLTGK